MQDNNNKMIQKVAVAKNATVRFGVKILLIT